MDLGSRSTTTKSKLTKHLKKEYQFLNLSQKGSVKDCREEFERLYVYLPSNPIDIMEYTFYK